MDRAERMLAEQYGRVDLRSSDWPFEHTDYYRDELGEHILRRFVCFENLILPDQIAPIKSATNDMERRVCDELGLPGDRRPVNLDPGYMSLSKLVLATTKDYAHRIYLGGGIYAEVTLHYESGGWRAWPWTYRDYAADTYHAFFGQMRERLKDQLKPIRDTGGGTA